MSARRPAPPSGMAPPATARLPDGVELELQPLAETITDRHLLRHPEDVERYGELARARGVHDTQHLISRAVLDAAGAAFARQAGDELNGDVTYLLTGDAGLAPLPLR